MTEKISLRADCARCAALCCVALAFDSGALFRVDKAAGEPCPHLTGCGDCGIHRSRAEYGFGGCIAYDCLGAGQRVTQSLFQARTWLDDRSLLGPMMAAFLTVRRAHDLLLLLRQASRLPLGAADRRLLAVLETAIEEAGAGSAAVARLADATHDFLRGLRRYVAEGDAAAAGEVERHDELASNPAQITTN